MIYGELGRLPIAIDIKIRMVSYWSKLVNGKQSKLSSILYRLTRQSNENYSIQYSWISCVKTILNDCGFSLIWDSEQFFNNEWLKYIVKQRLTDQFAQNWNSVVFHSTKSINYRIFKTKLEFENYFNVLNFSEAIKLCRFRTTNHHLPIETGRWKNIERENRLCHLCNCNKLGDEYHYMFEYTAFTEQRKKFVPNYYVKNHNVYKYSELMSSNRKSLLRNLCRFINIINDHVSAPGLPVV